MSQEIVPLRDTPSPDDEHAPSPDEHPVLEDLEAGEAPPAKRPVKGPGGTPRPFLSALVVGGVWLTCHLAVLGAVFADRLTDADASGEIDRVVGRLVGSAIGLHLPAALVLGVIAHQQRMHPVVLALVYPVLALAIQVALKLH